MASSAALIEIERTIGVSGIGYVAKIGSRIVDHTDPMGSIVFSSTAIEVGRRAIGNRYAVSAIAFGNPITNGEIRSEITNNAVTSIIARVDRRSPTGRLTRDIHAHTKVFDGHIGAAFDTRLCIGVDANARLIGTRESKSIKETQEGTVGEAYAIAGENNLTQTLVGVVPNFVDFE